MLVLCVDFVVGNEELAIMGLKTPFEVTELMDKKGAYYKLFSTQANRYISEKEKVQ